MRRSLLLITIGATVLATMLALAWGQSGSEQARAAGPEAGMSLSVPTKVSVGEKFTISIRGDPTPAVPISGFGIEVVPLPGDELKYNGIDDCNAEVKVARKDGQPLGLCLSQALLVAGFLGGRAVDVDSALVLPAPSLNVAVSSTVDLVNLSYQCNVPGTYKVTLDGDFEDQNGNVINAKTQLQDGTPVADTSTITCVPPLAASFTFAPANPQPNKPTAGKAVAFTAQVSGGTPPYTCSWDANKDGVDLVDVGCAGNFVHTFPNAGAFSVELAVADANDTLVVHNKQVSVVAQLEVDFSVNPANPPAGQQVGFTPDVSGGTPPYTCEWDVGNDGVDFVNPGCNVSFLHTVPLDTTGGFPMTLKVTDNNLTTNTRVKQVTLGGLARRWRLSCFGAGAQATVVITAKKGAQSAVLVQPPLSQCSTGVAGTPVVEGTYTIPEGAQKNIVFTVLVNNVPATSCLPSGGGSPVSLGVPATQNVSESCLASPGAEFTDIADAVGGLTVDLDGDLGELSLETAPSSSGNAGVLAGLVAAVTAGYLALTGAAWYARRRGLR